MLNTCATPAYSHVALSRSCSTYTTDIWDTSYNYRSADAVYPLGDFACSDMSRPHSGMCYTAPVSSSINGELAYLQFQQACATSNSPGSSSMRCLHWDKKAREGLLLTLTVHSLTGSTATSLRQFLHQQLFQAWAMLLQAHCLNIRSTVGGSHCFYRVCGCLFCLRGLAGHLQFFTVAYTTWTFALL